MRAGGDSVGRVVGRKTSLPDLSQFYGQGLFLLWPHGTSLNSSALTPNVILQAVASKDEASLVVWAAASVLQSLAFSHVLHVSPPSFACHFATDLCLSLSQQARAEIGSVFYLIASGSHFIWLRLHMLLSRRVTRCN